MDMRKAAERDELAARLSITEKKLAEKAASEDRLRRAIKEKEREMAEAEKSNSELEQLREFKEVRGLGSRVLGLMIMVATGGDSGGGGSMGIVTAEGD